jgi:hypothetical protein
VFCAQETLANARTATAAAQNDPLSKLVRIAVPL